MKNFKQFNEAKESTIDQIKSIIANKQHAKVGGKMIDLQTASIIVQIYNKVNSATKKKMENEKIDKLLKIASMVMRKESCNEETEKDLLIKSIDDLIKNPDPRMAKQYGGTSKYLKMLKSKRKKLESVSEAMAADYSKLSKVDLQDLIKIFKTISKPKGKKILKALEKEYSIRKNESIDINEDADVSLKKKAEKTGIPFSILKQVYNRGVAAWKTGHRPGTTPEQWGHARVNSFATKSKGTWGGADKDLAAKVK